MKTIIKKWRKYETTVIPRIERPSNIHEKTRWKLVTEAAKRPTQAPLKELQEHLKIMVEFCIGQQSPFFSVYLDDGVELKDVKHK